jgi:hypothetical protein
MITTKNIKAYIDFLYRKRYGSAAPQELVAKWSTVQPHQLHENLQKLYEHWALSGSAAKIYEEQFIEFLNPIQNESDKATTANTPIVESSTIDTTTVNSATNGQTSFNATKSKSALPAIIAVMLVCLMGGFAYNYFTSKSTEAAAEVATDAANLAPTELAPAGPAIPTAEPIAVADSIAATAIADSAAAIDATVASPTTDYTSVIQELLKADEQQDLTTTLNIFSDEVSQYYDIIMPSKEDIANEFARSWGKASNRRYYDVALKPLTNNSIEATGMMVYYSINDQQVRNIPFTARYVFDKDGKIIYQNKN